MEPKTSPPKKCFTQTHANCFHEGGIVRLTDPCMKETLARVEAEITKDRESALRFLQMIGVCTADGKLAKRYGG